MYVCVYLFCRKYYSGVLPSLYRTAEDLDMLPNFQLAHTQTATKHFTAIFMMFQVCMAYLFIYLSFLYILLTLEALDGQPLPVSSAGFTFFIVTPRFSSFSLLLKEREKLCVCVQQGVNRRLAGSRQQAGGSEQEASRQQATGRRE